MSFRLTCSEKFCREMERADCCGSGARRRTAESRAEGTCRRLPTRGRKYRGAAGHVGTENPDGNVIRMIRPISAFSAGATAFCRRMRRKRCRRHPKTGHGGRASAVKDPQRRRGGMLSGCTTIPGRGRVVLPLREKSPDRPCVPRIHRRNRSRLRTRLCRHHDRCRDR